MDSSRGAVLVTGLCGGMDLVAGAGADGRTVLRRQAFSPPIHISKPHHDGGWLVVNLASPSPGLLKDDRVNARVIVERDARLLITAPSATRIHNTGDGFAQLTQTFEVHSGAALDVYPEYLIPQAGARYIQNTTLRIAKGGKLLWTEMIAPGRTARGELFAFSELRLATDLYYGEEYVTRERYLLNERSVAALRIRFSEAYYASILAVGDSLACSKQRLCELTERFSDSAIWVGATRVRGNAWAIKVLAQDSPALRSAVTVVRQTICQFLGYHPANLRRTTGTPSG